MRPRKWYPILQWGEPVAIAHGLAEARDYTDIPECRGPVGVSFKTRLDAEEWCAWHTYNSSKTRSRSIVLRTPDRPGTRSGDFLPSGAGPAPHGLRYAGLARGTFNNRT